jgi:acyl carrier protein
MKHSIETAVINAVATHAEWNAKDVRLHQDLERDLHLQPLDLVVIALMLEDEEHFAFPFERLADVRTVRDLANAARFYGRPDARKDSLDHALFAMTEALV